MVSGQACREAQDWSSLHGLGLTFTEAWQGGWMHLPGAGTGALGPLPGDGFSGGSSCSALISVLGELRRIPCNSLGVLPHGPLSSSAGRLCGVGPQGPGVCALPSVLMATPGLCPVSLGSCLGGSEHTEHHQGSPRGWVQGAWQSPVSLVAQLMWEGPGGGMAVEVEISPLLLPGRGSSAQGGLRG